MSKRIAIGKNGVVINVVSYPDDATEFQCSEDEDAWQDDSGTVNPGDSYTLQDVKINDVDPTICEILFRLTNDVRVLQGKPEFSKIQFKTTVKSFL